MKRTACWAAVLAVLSLPLNAQDFRLGSTPLPPPLAASLPAARVSPSQNLGSGAGARSVDLSAYFPRPGSQGQQNSCVAWAVGYAVKSFQEHIERKDGAFDSAVFSPSFIYNQINGGRDQGSTLSGAGALLQRVGAVPMEVMPYSMDFRAQPNAEQLAQAEPYRIASFELVNAKQIEVVKGFLRQGLPVVFGMMVHNNFMSHRSGVYTTPTGSGLGGHAMVIVGFDDDRGAFRILNSWGTNWGEGGYAWVAYQTLADLTNSAMIMRDLRAPPPTAPDAPTGLSASQGTSRDTVTVTWNEAPGAASYQVFRSEAADGRYTLVGEVRGTTYLDRNVRPATLYYYSVKTLTEAGESPLSPVAQGFLQQVPGLGIPQNLRVTVSGTNVRLVWNPVSGAETYQIYRFDEAAGQFALVGRSRDPGWADSSLAARAATYYYLVTAAAGGQESANSNTVTAVTTVEVPRRLAMPRNARASQGRFADRVEVTWTPVTGAQAYEVVRYNSATRRWEVLGNPTEPRFVDTRPARGLQYYGVAARAGAVVSPRADYLMGFTSASPHRSTEKRFADNSYFGQFNGEAARSGREEWFRGDQFFSDSKTFFDNFVPQDFFFVDTAKFFEVDPNFFKVEENFFDNSDNFFR